MVCDDYNEAIPRSVIQRYNAIMRLHACAELLRLCIK